MVIDDTGNQDTHSLSCGHNESENEWPEGSNGIENEELSNGRTDGEDGCVEGKLQVLEEEGDSGEEHSSEQEGADGEDCREEVDAKHHLNRRYIVLFKELRLPVGRETVKGHVTEEDNYASKSSICRVGFC